MAESVKAATLEPISDEMVNELLASTITRFHEGLTGAKIALLWLVARPVSFWGAVKIASEESWWLSDGHDLILKLNKTLWDELGDAARLGLLDHLLSLVESKTGGKTQMTTKRGTRTLYEASSPSLSVHPHVIARNPDFVAEVSELAKLHKAVTDPKQFLLEFGEDGDGDGGGDTDDVEEPAKLSAVG